MTDNALAQLEDELGIEFRDRRLLREALTHRSYLNETSQQLEHNERLEFVGDAVIELIVRAYFYEEQREMSEGDMTQAKTQLVNNEFLGQIGRSLKLGHYLSMSEGERRSGSPDSAYMNACAFEALVGAIYQDRGIGSARAIVDHFIIRRLRDMLRHGIEEHPKVRLQKETQAREGSTPSYRTISSRGPDHSPYFVVEVILDGKVLAQGEGGKKKEAQAAAAQRALELHYTETQT